jgi:hypothetical protein
MDAKLTSLLWIVRLCSLNTSHFLWKIQLPKPSSFMLTDPLRKICELLGSSGPRFGEPPIPEYGNAYDEPEGDAGVKVNDELYPEFARLFDAKLELSGPRLWGACGAGRDGVSDCAVTWLYDIV